jgi:hypothetical protein
LAEWKKLSKIVIQMFVLSLYKQAARLSLISFLSLLWKQTKLVRLGW